VSLLRGRAGFAVVRVHQVTFRLGG
jgi:hypothetical protein